MLPFGRDKLRKRRCDIGAPTYASRSIFASRQNVAQAPRVYNKLNRKLNIYPMQLHECKRTLSEWLFTVNYDDMEDIEQHTY